ncbi:MAG: glycerol-3-phosphate dehydrogenase [Methyloceanibacter sp.]
MATDSFDLLVIGGGIHGAAVARDAAGRGLKVMLAEKGDYASATSSGSTKLIHGGLRYLEQLDFGLVRESLVERGQLLKTAPHLVAPIRFLLPVYDWQKRGALVVQAGLGLYDILSIGHGLPASGRLSDRESAALPGLRREGLRSVLQYCDCQADDARLTLSVALDARASGADLLNRRAVTAIDALADGYAVELNERGRKRRVDTRFIVNAGGAHIAKVDAMTTAAPPARALRLVRGSHLVLPMPDPAFADAFTLQDEDDRVVFAIPWLDGRFLMVGTTDVPHYADPGDAHCSADEQAYLLDAYNRYFSTSRGPVTLSDVVFTWSGVRALHDDTEAKPSRLSRKPALSSIANGNGGFVTIYGGKLTTHRILAEKVLDAIAALGAQMGPTWTKDAPLHGGGLSRRALLARAVEGPDSVPQAIRRRWALTYGDQIEYLYARLAADPATAEEIAPGVPTAELAYAVEAEDAMTAEDFLLRRTKLQLLLDEAGCDAVEMWFERTIT